VAVRKKTSPAWPAWPVGRAGARLAGSMPPLNRVYIGSADRSSAPKIYPDHPDIISQ